MLIDQLENQSPEMLSSASDEGKLFAENFSKKYNLDDFFPAFSSRTNLKLQNISVTTKLVITNLDSSKVSGLDYIPVVVLKNC